MGVVIVEIKARHVHEMNVSKRKWNSSLELPLMNYRI